MASKHHLSSGELPDMKIIDGLDTVNSHEVFFDFVNVDIFWNSLHDNIHALLDNSSRGEENNDRKHEGADWINDFPVWFIENNTCSDDDTSRLDQITKDMDLSSSLV